MTAAIERIVVQTTPQDKEAIAAKARRLEIPIGELMRRAAFAYEADASDAQLVALADAARSAAERSCDAIDDALAFIDASNARIDALRQRSPKATVKRARKAA